MGGGEEREQERFSSLQENLYKSSPPSLHLLPLLLFFSIITCHSLANLLQGPIQGVNYCLQNPLWHGSRVSGDLSWPNGLACPTHSERRDMLWTLSVKEFQLEGSSRKKSLFCHSPHLWYILLLKLKSAPTILAFWNSLKTWLCQLAWSINEGTLGWRWLCSDREGTSIPFEVLVFTEGRE